MNERRCQVGQFEGSGFRVRHSAFSGDWETRRLGDAGAHIFLFLRLPSPGSGKRGPGVRGFARMPLFFLIDETFEYPQDDMGDSTGAVSK
jgi:hypothetical protein